MRAKSAMHQCRFPISDYPPVRISPATRPGLGQYGRVHEGTTAEEESGSVIRGTQESDRTAPLASAEIEVCAGTILPSSCCTEHQTVSFAFSANR